METKKRHLRGLQSPEVPTANASRPALYTKRLDPIDRFCEALEEAGSRVRPSGDGFSANCPAHDDRNPSLSVTEGDDGRLLVHCHAGCEYQEILDSLHLESGDLFVDSGHTGRDDDEPQEWVFIYHDEGGYPLRKVTRVDNPDGTKKFCQFRHTPQGWQRGVRDVRDVPYRLPVLIEGVDRGDTVFVVEGEKCVEALSKRKLLATTNPAGAGKWPNSFRRFFMGAHVILLPDNDDVGRRHMEHVAANLAPVVSTLTTLELPGLTEGGDVWDWMADGGTRQMLLNLVDTAPSGLVLSASTAWETPPPLDPRPSLPPFPLEALPKFLSDYVTAVSKSTQTPVDLAGMLALATTAAATSGLRIRIRPGFTVPLNLYLVVVLAVGEGKSPVYREMMQVLDRIEAQLQNEAAPAISEAKARKTVAEANWNAIKKRLASLKLSTEDRVSLTSEVKEAQVAFEEVHVPYPPRLYTQDATPEGLLKLMGQQGGRMAVLDDEGGELFELLSRYSKSGRANQGIYLRGHDGGRFMSDWSTKDPVDLNEVMLTLGLTVQPQVIRDLSGDPALRGRGLLARMLYSLPLSDVGYRDHLTKPVPKDLRDRFTDIIGSLAHERFESRGKVESTIRFGADAVVRFNEWAQKHEVRLRPGKDLGSIADWGNKLPSQVARLAGNLHALYHPESPGEKLVTADTVERSIKIADYFAAHAKAAFNLMGSDPVIFKAILVAEWLSGKREVTQREIHRSRQDLFENANEVTKVIELLIDSGYLRRPEGIRSRGGGRPSTRLEVNPLIP